MKKVISFVLAAILLVSMVPTAFAVDTTRSTTLTTEVPDAEYTLNIPIDQSIDFGTTSKKIGNVTITDAKHFAVGKNIEVAISYDGTFKSEDVSTKIPFVLQTQYSDIKPKDVASGSTMLFKGKSDTTVSEIGKIGDYDPTENLYIAIASEDWGKALGGVYSASITFTAKVVVEE